MTPDQIKTLAHIGAKLSQLGVTTSPLPLVSEGPIVTAFRFTPTGSTKFSQIESLGDDLAITLGVEDVFIKRLPGESAVSVMVPNPERRFFSFRECVGNIWNSPMYIPIAFGVDFLGKPFMEDLVLLPHLLIAGSTNSGKSTLMSSILASLIYTKKPEDIKFILSDTKSVEFGHFIGAPHLLCEPLTTVEKTFKMMNWVVDKMEERLKDFGNKKVRNILEYKQRFPEGKKLPFIVFVFDELADILTDRTKDENDNGKPTGPTLGKRCTDVLAKIVQKSRATGIHMIAATQRPSVNIVSGTVKSNFPARLTFRLPSGVDSRTVIDTEGAEHLLAQGDMLYVSPNKPGLMRLHSPYASIEDIDAAVEQAKLK